MPIVFIFSAFAIIVATVAGAKPRELQTLTIFSPASIFLITNILVSKVRVFLVLFTLVAKEDNVFLDGRHGWKIHSQLNP